MVSEHMLSEISSLVSIYSFCAHSDLPRSTLHPLSAAVYSGVASEHLSSLIPKKHLLLDSSILNLRLFPRKVLIQICERVAFGFKKLV